ncbi:FecR family protein [Xanthovirga aplysinae]|uniref:FecR family protein n=1 Tax=Xanthovirga aplysinae TaxID=2529853 RepID=UPI0012BC4672|nr:FecR domain-containing protein [Xanthovirga aplysinae]MTI32228.1 FecR family protein [Xanthovirga aplysinae]
MKYQEYSAEDFAQDPFFCQWVLCPDQNTQKFWEKWRKENPDKEKELQKGCKIIQVIHGKEKEIPQEKIDHLWKAINDKIEAIEKPAIRTIADKTFQNQWYNIAAAIVLIAIGVFYFFNRPEVIQAKHGEKLSHVLPDGTEISLNAGTTLTYNKKKWGKSRMVHFDGEGFFRVTKGEPFLIKTQNGTVLVLGTSFNIYSRNAKLSVECFTGKVQVDSKDAAFSALLTPGKGVKMTEKTTRKYGFDTQSQKGWRFGSFFYDDIPLTEVLDEIERQYDITIETQTDISQRKYSGEFDKNELKSTLDMVCLPMELNYEVINAQKVIIRK